MAHKLKYLVIVLICTTVRSVFAQVGNPTYPGQQQQRPPYSRDTSRNTSRRASENLDSVRMREENKKDSVVFNSKYIKVTNERLLNDSTQLFPLDTGLVNFENYSVLSQPRNP